MSARTVHTMLRLMPAPSRTTRAISQNQPTSTHLRVGVNHPQAVKNGTRSTTPRGGAIVAAGDDDDGVAEVMRFG